MHISLQPLVEELRRMFEKYLVKVLEFKKKNCVELVTVAELNGVISLTKLFDALATVKNGVGTQSTINIYFREAHEITVI